MTSTTPRIIHEPDGPGLADGRCWVVVDPSFDTRFATEQEALAYVERTTSSVSTED